MSWPSPASNATKPDSTLWNQIISALSLAGGSYNANQQVFSNYLQINIAAASDQRALFISSPALVGAGLQSGGRVFYRVNSFDTVNHTLDFIFNPLTITNAGTGALRIFTSLDGAIPTEIMRWTSAGFVGIGTAPASPLHVHVGTNQNFSVASIGSACAVQAINDAASVWVPLVIEGLPMKFGQNATGLSIFYVPNALSSNTTFDGNLWNGSVTFWVDEANNLLTFRAKYSSGTLKKGTVALV